jgi:hypothetical protein
MKSAQPEETDFHATHADEYAGQGGAYEIVEGKRVLVSRTADPEPVAATATPSDNLE